MSEPGPAPTALSIAGTDPTGGAGIELDLQVFALHGVHGMAVPTALNAQTTRGVHSTYPSFPNVVGQQLSLLLEDMRPDAIKLGMLATDDVLLRVAGILERFEIPRVVDPILQASDGTWLLERRDGHIQCFPANQGYRISSVRSQGGWIYRDSNRH